MSLSPSSNILRTDALTEYEYHADLRIERDTLRSHVQEELAGVWLQHDVLGREGPAHRRALEERHFRLTLVPRRVNVERGTRSDVQRAGKIDSAGSLLTQRTPFQSKSPYRIITVTPWPAM